ncbi:urease accessory protein UreF [Georgenia subflava]|uniref:Urease accessory protein UreF n=1 Tax=Georgenia subflava TaxID=1622177 RepID=A0A6N7EJT5_9MICO|nr:urease accessory UreF family protein [Georgenia subflava]MPV37338.1 urease accessory protein UreF [Georgenia subflava]
MTTAALLLLTDGRFPTGAYAHSAGLEASVQSGRVRDVAGLESFLRGRVHTTGVVVASFAAAACAATASEDDNRLQLLEDELDARTPSPALRAVSRALGRQLLRAVNTIAPHPKLTVLPPAPHHPIALGGAAAALGLAAGDAALAALYDSVTGPANAAAKVLPLDPFRIHAALVRLMPSLEQLASTAADYATTAPDQLPASGAPLIDVGAEHHARWEGRLFAS